MKTNVIMQRSIDNYTVLQRTEDGFFDANTLLTQWNYNHPDKRDRDMLKFLESPKTSEFIEQIKEDESHTHKSVNSDFQAVIKQKGRNTKNGKTKDKVWMHPYLFIDFAMWINPRFKIKVIKFVYDQLIEFRDLSGDLYKDLSRAVTRFSHVNYIQLAKGLNYIVFGRHENGIRQTATPEQLIKLNDLQKKLAYSIDMGYVKNFKHLIKEMRRLYNINQYNKIS